VSDRIYEVFAGWGLELSSSVDLAVVVENTTPRSQIVLSFEGQASVCTSITPSFPAASVGTYLEGKSLWARVSRLRSAAPEDRRSGSQTREREDVFAWSGRARKTGVSVRGGCCRPPLNRSGGLQGGRVGKENEEMTEKTWFRGRRDLTFGVLIWSLLDTSLLTSRNSRLLYSRGSGKLFPHQHSIVVLTLAHQPCTCLPPYQAIGALKYCKWPFPSFARRESVTIYIQVAGILVVQCQHRTRRVLFRAVVFAQGGAQWLRRDITSTSVWIEHKYISIHRQVVVVSFAGGVVHLTCCTVACPAWVP